MTGLDVRDFTPARFRAQEAAFLAIAADVAGERWRARHFLLDLPDKWRLSFALWSAAGVPVAYAVVSRKERAAHIHHFMVAAPLRGRGLGARMLGEAEARAAGLGCRRLTLKVAEANLRARRFYAGHGFRSERLEGDHMEMAKPLAPGAGR